MPRTETRRSTSSSSEIFWACSRWDDAVDGFLCKVFHSEDFCAGETGLAKDGLADLSISCGVGARPVALRALIAAVNGAAALPEMDW